MTKEQTPQRYEEYGYTLPELAALCRTKDREIERLQETLKQFRIQPAQHYHQNCATCTCREPVEIRDPYRPQNTADV